MKRSDLNPSSALAHVRGALVDLETENIATLAERAAGVDDLIQLWYGEGDLVTPEPIRAAAIESLSRGETFYVPQMAGRPDLAMALTAYQSRLHGIGLGADRTTLTPGGMQAVHLALSLMLQPGDNAVYVEPQWPNIRQSILMTGAEPRPVALEMVGGDWQLDLQKVFDTCDARTRAIIFSSPSNPCGWMAGRETYEALLAFSRRTGIWIVSDEVYARLVPGKVAPSLLQVAEPEDLALCINGFSKAWAMTGWRVGWLNHPASVAGTVRAMTQYVNSGTAAFVQAGALAALETGEDTVTTVRDRCRAGLDAAYEILGRSQRVVLPAKPGGGMYAFFRIEDEPDATAFCAKMVTEAHVGLAPGGMFGAPFRGYVRMCVARETHKIETACERVLAAL
ncbi:aminotransferase class I/II-fold pyridoxal phosphate-dependent enzyme [Acidimangrovimonas sediminis]|uniref:aminotransferase class I/II-fold pyridoxal phosphate-dependent enzyme n=1 Tax=Acidimangrovimonas sediminis TaxID=2056283 RepID=UPI000C80B3EA|nr:aminotransferase class I/II-fold pyridoxal phosphate-dependent enzyme [Acidimangrovimonas sediminis]